MKKRIISILLSFFILISAAMPIQLTVLASDYETQLLNAGFPESYIPALAELHKKYPNWNFKPLKTGVNWSTAVAEERTPHSQQLIQKISSNNGKNYYCTCSSCYKNGNYVIQEGQSWVSASQTAVEYYMNPTNFLDERYIFQFESTEYDSSQTISGIETILKGTWMYDSEIYYYKNENQPNVKYTNSVYTNGMKYSQAILEASKVSKLSAYYLASKIVQEVGGKEPTAGGASGRNSQYPGIYNYYNIGAYTGALDGLKWASQGSSGSGYTTNTNARLREGPTTNSTHLVTLPAGTKLNYISATDKQADGYRWYYVSAAYEGKTYTGYIRSDLVNNGTADKYGRPWTNPFLTIYNGAKYIANNFAGTQYTGYLQKFNVNPASSNMYSHEYMANVQAAASEASKAYNAYRSAGLLSAQKNFVIPVFNNMPGSKAYSSDIPAVTNIQPYDINDTSFSLVCDVVPGASGYDIMFLNNGTWQYIKSVDARRVTLNNLKSGTKYTIRMRAYIRKEGYVLYSTNYSEPIEVTTLTRAQMAQKIPAPSGIQIYDINSAGFSISCDVVGGASGYEIQYNKDGGSWINLGSINARRGVFTGLESGTKYNIRMRAFIYSEGSNLYSNNWSETVSFYTKPNKVTEMKTVARGGTGEKLKISWKTQSDADGYNVYRKENGKYVLKGTTTANEYTFEDLVPGWEYYFRVTAYKGEPSNAGYGSDEFHTCAACPPMNAPILTKAGTNTIKVDWNIVNSHGYVIQWSTDSKFDTDLNSLYVTGHNVKSYSITTKDNAEKYYVRVRAWRNFEGGMVYGVWSSGSSINTETPNKVTGLYTAARGGTGDKLRIEWDAQENADSYNVYSKVGGNWTFVGNTKEAKFTFENLVPGWEYYYRVSAVGNGVEGPLSEEFHTCAACPPMRVPSVIKTGTNSLLIKWDIVNSHGYVIQWSTDPTFEKDLNSLYITGHEKDSYTLTTKENAEKYFVRVRAWRNFEGGMVYGVWSESN